MANLVGETIGQYEVVEHLGQGGMADVYKAFHPGLAIYRALKVIRMELGAGSDFKERFQREAQSVATLRHPNIVRMHDFGIHEGLYYMVMEFIEGQDLKALLTERGPVRPLTDIADIVDQVAAALSYAHDQGVVHRDVKPANIMRTTGGQIILTDFGVAKMLTTDEPITQTGVGIGTPAYMSPEQAQGRPDVGPATDIYSLGVVIYQMLSGRVPYSADTPMAVALKVLNEPLPPLEVDVSDRIRGVVRKATAKEASNRYASATDLAEALKAAVSAEPTSSETVTMPLEGVGPAAESAPDSSKSPVPPVPEPETSSAGWVIAGLLLAFLVLAGGGLYGFRSVWMPVVGIGDETSTVPEQQPLATEAQPGPLPADSSQDALVEMDTSASPERAQVEASIEETASESDQETAPNSTPETEAVAEENQRSAEADPAPATGEPASQEAADSAPRADQSQQASPGPSPATAQTVAANRRGVYVQDAIDIPGQKAEHTLDGKQGQRIFFDFIGSTADADFILRAPDGAEVLRAFMQDAGPVTLEQTGTYTVAVDPWGQATPEYEFAIIDRIPETGSTTSIQLNTPVQDRIDVPGQSATFTFEAQADQQIFFDFVSSSADADFILQAPDGDQVFKTFMQDAGPVMLDQTGTYTLTVDAWDQAAPAFEFVVRVQ